MRNLYDALPSSRRGGYASQSSALEPQVLDAVSDGDADYGQGLIRLENGSDREGAAAQICAACRDGRGRNARLIAAMLYWLADFSDKLQFLNIFRYITFRTGGALMTAAVFMFIAGSPIIDWLRAAQGKGQPIRADGPQSHLKSKIGTPTMGGLMIIFAVTHVDDPVGQSVQPLCVDRARRHARLRHHRFLRRLSEGDEAAGLATSFSGKLRITAEAIVAILACLAISQLGRPAFATSLTFPFFKDLIVDLGWFFLVFGAFIIVGAGNAVNLTDGLDGLAIVPVMIAALSFGLIAYLAGNALFADYLQIHYVAGTGELAVLCGAVIGAGLGFLWFNAPPASIFMGDTGSLALGGLIGSIAVATKHEIALAIIGGLFVLEAVSVIVQVISFRLTGKRIFRMAPIHHHYEQKGWTEPQIVIRFWIISIVLALIGLSTLKLR